jgi:biofilm PGA synthesis N-glycosyltransferase PgaC
MKYAILTAVKNESAYIEHTLRSVVAQSVAPEAWIIVDDGSTDDTKEIAKKYAAARPWIKVVSQSAGEKRSFGGKARAINMAFELVKDMPIDAVANLDGDISLDPDQFEFLLDRLGADPQLGIVGTAYLEEHYDWRKDRHQDASDVSGACQLFRIGCFSDIGGYQPISVGGIDWLAVNMARMKGWKTHTYSERTFFHHKPHGSGVGGILRARFRYGYRDYVFGSYPLWQVFRVAFQMTRKPFFAGGLMIGAGYIWGCISRPKHPVDMELIGFRRREQIESLRRLWAKHMPLSRYNKH